MNTRIRYAALADGMLQSVQMLKADSGIEYYVVISADNRSAHVVEAVTKLTVKTVYGTNPGATRIAAKRALVELGVSFGSETRTKSASRLSGQDVSSGDPDHSGDQ